ncbi:unnamed protein product [Bursaphelenchus xylophilus]|uniref:(pine wood nematode) hypothetical protein n=1 Tax=Bursaphelenchus xylophilus TaxID=6326 RepID=A0A1I7SD68_BURXY|nr:unnamed protein product [Bursaphelenchus xylophilus]CAG9130520.1 unnamed protein product [Bursaphelenchus xylophilus]
MSVRLFTAQQAAVALRPFYFLVHPDRFAHSPEVQKKNEKSLQIFNGYLNELFPQPREQRPVQVRFSIMKNDKLRDVAFELSGNDPVSIVKNALEKCELSTENLPKVSVQPRPYSSPFNAEDLWNNLQQREIKRRKRHQKSLLQHIIQKRAEAVEKTVNYQKTKEFIQDEVSYVQQKTGLKEIIWSMNWDQSYMRRCLINVLHMLKHSSNKERVVLALHNHTLIFGRGSFICCDGSIQFGADDVPEAWLDVCIESTVRRFEVRNLVRLLDRVKELLGGAEVIYDPRGNLLQTTHQLQSLIVRISSRSKAEMNELAEVARNLQVEICNSYSEINIRTDGRLQIPSIVDGKLLLNFIKDNKEEILRRRKNFRDLENEIDNAKRRCIIALGLDDLSFDAGIPEQRLLSAVEQLRTMEDVEQFKGLHLHISHSPNVFVMTNGAISVPLT